MGAAGDAYGRSRLPVEPRSEVGWPADAALLYGGFKLAGMAGVGGWMDTGTAAERLRRTMCAVAALARARDDERSVTAAQLGVIAGGAVVWVLRGLLGRDVRAHGS